jgi:hypothetical protein
MAVVADRCPWRTPVFVAVVLVNIVTTNTRWKVGAVQRDFAYVLKDMSIARVQALVIGF